LLYHGKPSIQIIITDITNRKLAEENIRSNEARLKSIVNILQYNTESPQDFLSYALEEAVNLTDSKYGYIFHYDSARQEFVNVNFSRQALKDTNIEHKPKIFPLAETGIWGEVVRQNRSIILNDFQAYHPLKKGHPPGHVKLTKFMSIPIIDSGRIIAVVGMANKAIDYTETDVLQLTLLMDSVWKMAENKKRDAEIRKFYRAVEQSPVSIVITDVSGIIEYANDFLCKITGFTPAELLGSHTRILKSNETPAEVYQDLWKTILAGKTWSGELRNRKKNGELYWEDASISPVLNQDGKIINFIGVKEDITQRKEMTNRLMRAMAEAEQMNKLKSNFLANMSHELRTPLVGILGYSELLPSMIDDPDAVDMVNTIHVSGKRLLNTLNMVLDLSRIEADRQEIRWETVELNNLLQTIMHLFSINAQKKKLSLSYQTFADEIKFKTDSYLIEHIVNDLINNAIKYTQSGGVLVETRLDRTSAEARLQIVVTDTGIGIPPDQLEIIFDAFRQASEGYGRSFEGTGLGLTITKKYVELLGGEISVTSELGKGSCFTISFPADYLRQTGQDFTATLVDASIPGTGNPSPIMSKQTVLLIDDDEISHMLVSNMLRDVVKIESATTGFEAMEKIKHRVYPAILLDINLRTGLSGLDVVSMIRQIPAYHNVPVVAVTAFTMLGDKEKFLASGCTHYLSKPFSQQELRSVIHDILG
jgi:PAS domain S-box-containing protein